MKLIITKLTAALVLLTALPFFAFSTTYYISQSGSDNNNGTSTATAFKTIAKVNSIQLLPGDMVRFEGGSSFAGTVTIAPNDQGNASQPITVTSYGSGRATINAGDSAGIYVYNLPGIEVRDINFVGSPTSNQPGVYFFTDRADMALSHITIEDVEVSGFYDYGVKIYCLSTSKGFSDVLINRVMSHDNQNGGIVSANDGVSVFNHHNITVTNCKTYNNKGIPGYDNQSGNGILITSAVNALIDHCEAYNNGENNEYGGGGPVGIWFSVVLNSTIQHCESHHNRTKTIDGGGFDLDGGCQNSTIQYCYSHDNVGAGYLLAEYGTGIPFTGNTVRYNISENDGTNEIYGSIVIWGADNNSVVTNSRIYNNTIFSTHIGVSLFDSNFSNITVSNNVFYCQSGSFYIQGSADSSKVHFVNNDYFQNGSGSTYFNWNSAYYNSLDSWRTGSGTQEKVGNTNYGVSVNPMFNAPGTGRNGYVIGSTSPVIDRGLDMGSIGAFDFYGGASKSGNAQDIGANEFQSATNPAPKDTTAPSVPANLKVVSVTTNAARIAWDNSTDNISVKGYDIYINGAKKYTTVTDSVTIPSLVPDSSFSLSVRAFDSSGNVSAFSQALAVKAAKDTIAPSIPANLKVVAVTTSSARLAWDNSTDNIGVKGYDVYINGTKKYSTVTDSVTVPGLIPDSLFSVAVKAFDSSGNVSAFSAPLLVRAAKDTAAPSIPVNLKVVNVSISSARIAWDNSTDNIGVKGYDVYINGLKKYTTVTDSVTVPNLVPDSSFSVTVKAFDSSGNISASSASLAVKAAKDTIAPSVPVNLKVVSITTASARIAWDNSTDNIGVKGYDVYVNGAKKYTTVTDSITVPNLIPDSSFSLTVKAFDSSGNVSLFSAPLVVKATKDTIAPSMPVNLKIVSVTISSARIAWDNSTDNVSVKGYDVYINGTKKYTTVTDSVTVLNLVADSSFNVAVRAFDSSGNVSALSVALTVKASKDTIAPSVPVNLKIVSITAAAARVAWDNSTDNIGVKGYDIYINGTKKYTTLTDSVTIAGLVPDSSFSVAVRAFDSSGNVSALSAALAVKASKDSIAPSIPVNLKVVSINTSTARIAWDNSTDNIGVKGYDVYINGAKKYSTVTDSVTVPGLIPDSSFSVSVRAFDSSGNVSALSGVLVVKAAKDTIAPSIPLNMKVVNVTISSARVTWDNSTDNIAATGYDVYINNVKKYTTVTDSITIASLKADSTFSVTVKAFDAAGNMSGFSAPLTVKAARDTIPPSVPVNLKIVGVTTNSARVSWDNVTDNVAVKGYDVFINGVNKYATITDSITISNLVADSSFSLAVRSVDSAGNVSVLSVSLTVKAASNPSAPAPGRA